MRSTEERIALLHRRADILKDKQDRTRIRILGGVSAGLLVALVAVVIQFAGGTHQMISDQFTGSSMLSEGAGGYVLTAVLAFAAAVIITVLCIRIKNRSLKNKNKNDEQKNTEGKA